MYKLILIIAIIYGPTFAQAWPGDVLTVHDGDTVRVQPADGEAVSIRVYGVDCPELGQPYGTEARDMTAQLLKGRRVEIIPAQTRKSYKREVAGVVLLDDMIVLQDALISAGLAWVDSRFCRMAVCDLWRQHQADAKASRRGLWVDDSPIPPWAWRRMLARRIN
jgi:endonuclease YncB( thermonuclease family)